MRAMHNMTSPPWHRPLAGLVAAAFVTVTLAACGANRPVSDAATSGPTTTIATTAPSPTNTSGSTTGSTPASTPGTGDASYTSAITDSEVANPAFDDLERDITRRITEAGLPGASLLVLQDGKLVEQDAFGEYDLTTEVPIASASKWLSGATIMTLVDDGLIDLDEPIRTYLPEAKGPSGAITTRQLMAFTSGLEYDDRIPCYSDFTKSVAQCNSEILALPLLAKPGTGYRYTGTHLHVAAGVAEAVTGQTWEAIFQERVAQPLGMTKTTFVGGEFRMALSGDGHPAPAGSATSTLGDYGRFLEMIIHDGVAPDGTRILTSASIDEMAHDQTGDSAFISAAPNHKAAETPYGIAHWLEVVDAEGNAIVESSPGKFGFRPWIDHANNMAGVYLVLDKDDTHVADSPDNTATTPTVQTSSNFVIHGSIKALGGKAPAGLQR